MHRLRFLLEDTDARIVLDRVAARCLPYVVQGVLAEAYLAGMPWSDMLACLSDDDCAALERIVIERG